MLDVKENIFSEVHFLELLIESLKEEYTDYVSELTDIFYEYEMTCYYSEAESILMEYGVFKGIDEVIDYEKTNYGEVYVNVSNPCEVANKLFTIKAFEYVSRLESNNKRIATLINSNWSDKFTTELREQLLELMEEELASYDK